MASEILKQPSEHNLADAVEENLFDLFRAMTRSLEGELEQGPQLCRHLSFPENPMFKGVWRTRLAEDDAEDAISETIEWFGSRNAPYAFWWTGPETTPHDLGDRLEARGLISMEGQSQELTRGLLIGSGGAPCMAADLYRLNEQALFEVPYGFEISEVDDEHSLEEFKRLLIEVYKVPDWTAGAWFEATMHCGLGNTPWRMHLGRLEGRPVATNMLFNGGGVAGIYEAGVVPDVRGRGIGGAIALQALLEARAAGFRHAVLFSSAMGVHAYERIGFRQTRASINRYLWRNETG